MTVAATSGWIIEHQHQDSTWSRVTKGLPDELSQEQAQAYADALSREETLFRFREGGRCRAMLLVKENGDG